MNQIFGVWKKKPTTSNPDAFTVAIDLFCQNKFAFDSIVGERYSIYISSNSKRHEIFTRKNCNVFGHAGYVLNLLSLFNSEEPKTPALTGKFLLVWLHKSDGVLTLCNDRLGHFPVFYIDTPEYFCFASDIKYLFAIDRVNLTIDKQRVAEYFYWGQTWPTTTFFLQIHMLEPSVQIDFYPNGTMQFSRHEYIPLKIHSGGLSKLEDTFSEILSQVLVDYASYFGKLHCTLTGGLDTRIIAGHLDASIDAEFITIANPNVDENKNNEILIARRIADKLKRPHRVIQNPYYPRPVIFDENYFDDQKIPDNLTPLVAGVFGSEIIKLQGPAILHKHLADLLVNAKLVSQGLYMFYYIYPTIYRKKSVDSEMFFDFTELFNQRFDKSLFLETIKQRMYQASNAIKHSPVGVLCDFLVKSYYSNFYGGSRGGNFNHTDFFNNLLMPFIDERILEFIANVPFQLLGLHEKSLYFSLFSKKLKQLAQIPTNSLFTDNNRHLFLSETVNINPFFKQSNNHSELLQRALQSNYLSEFEIFDMNRLGKCIQTAPGIADCFVDLSVLFRYYANKNINLNAGI